MLYVKVNSRNYFVKTFIPQNHAKQNICKTGMSGNKVIAH